MRNREKDRPDGCPPDSRPAPLLSNEEAEARLSELCRALAHPARVRILRVLLERDVCLAGELVDEVPLAASTVSQHLKILKDAGLIKGEVDGPRRCYCADRSVVEQLDALLEQVGFIPGLRQRRRVDSTPGPAPGPRARSVP